MQGENDRQPDPLAVPSPWIRRFAHLVRRGGTVLDVAAGGGRHARFFRDRGHAVTAVDRNLEGLRSADGLTLVEADLEAGPWPFPGGAFDALVVTNYLHRPLLPILVESIAPGGVLLYETFAEGQGEFGRPSNPDYLLKPGELLAAVAGRLQVVAFEHGIDYGPGPSARQRLAAVRGEGLQPL